MGNFIDLTGQKYGRLTVIKRVPKPEYLNNKRKLVYWLCKCDCGNETICTSNRLRSGNTKSCGCIWREMSSELGKCNKKYNTYDLSGEYGIGYTSKDEEFYFDLEDYDKIKDYCWHKVYDYLCCTLNNRKNIRMHCLILNHPASKYSPIDHINRIKYDNRKENLRICTMTDNLRNRYPQNNNTTGVIGITWHKKACRWIARINIGDKKRVHLGSFTNKEEAIKSRLQAEANIYGEFAPQHNLFEEYNIKTEREN